MGKKYYGKGIPGLSVANLKGSLIVIEGPDGSGRSTQVQLLRDSLERLGYPTAESGLKRSTLVGPELEEAMEGNILGPTTLSLFYATDFADRLENNIIPALRAGFVVVADRYFYSLIARDVVRGAPADWSQAVYGMAVVPDLVVYLELPPKRLVERSFQKQGQLNYWESGMDIQRSGDMYQCFIRYQTELAKQYKRMSKIYDFKHVDGNGDPLAIHEKIKGLVERVLKPRQGSARDPINRSVG